MSTIKELEEQYKGYHLEEYFQVILPFAKNAIQIELTQLDSIGIGMSKMGGRPDLPKSVEWLVNEETGNPLTFIAQINLAEAVPYDSEHLLPKEGMLYFFYDIDEFTWGYDPKDKPTSKVYYYDGELSELENKQIPADKKDDEDFYFSSASITFKKMINLPAIESDAVSYKMEDKGYDAYFDLKAEEEDMSNKLLGHSDIIQNGMELQCELVTNGLYCGDSSGYNDPRRKVLEANIDNWTLLFQVDSNDECEMMWGDLGRLYYWIKKEDLKNKNFDAVWTILQCG